MFNSQLLDILLIAMIAGFILFRLYLVLGRRTGHERPPRQNYRLPGSGEAPLADAKIAVLPGRDELPARERVCGPAAQGMLDIKLADRNFETEKFLAGARGAYEMITSAFAKGDRAALRPLLSDEVYEAFDSAIKQREGQAEQTIHGFTGFKDVKIVHASLVDDAAEITISFTANFTAQDAAAQSAEAKSAEAKSAEVKDAKSAPQPEREITDIWTFSRKLRAGDPNWTLVATSGDFA